MLLCSWSGCGMMCWMIFVSGGMCVCDCVGCGVWWW